MSPTQPGPLQSKVLSYVLRQTRHWTDRSKIALRRFTLAANWTAQIVLYPIYVAVQAVRLVGAAVKQAIALDIAAELSPPTPTNQVSSPSELTATAPVQHALQTVQTFTLSTELPILLEEPCAALAQANLEVDQSSRAIALHTAAKLVKTLRSWIKHLTTPLLAPYSASRSAPPALPVHPIPFALHPPTHFIRAIATLLETRTLVLVTNQNQILDILNPEQQTRLRQRIAWETAHYGRYLRLRQETRQAFGRLPSTTTAHSHVLLPIRLLQKGFRLLMAWVQTGPLATSTNLFREASLFPAQQATALSPAAQPIASPPLLPAWSPLALLSGKLEDASEVGSDLGSRALPLIPPFTPIRGALTSGGAIALAAPEALNLKPEATWDPATWDPANWDYIDTHATSIGYVLGPLETALRWLDRALLWLENTLVQLWQRLQQAEWITQFWQQIQQEKWQTNLWKRIQQLVSRFF